MPFHPPKDLLQKAEEAAFTRHQAPLKTTLVLAFLAGAYIALGGFLAITVGGGLPGLAASNPGLKRLLTGAVFPLGLILCVVAGSDLFTGNTAYFMPPVLSRRMKVSALLRNWTVVWTMNFAGSLFVALVLAYGSGLFQNDPWHASLVATGTAKTSGGFLSVFIKGIGANWLVALAVWLAFAAQDIGGKILALWFPVMAFVAIGFEHSVANMFFLPAAWAYGAPITWTDILVGNLLPATLGNIVGGAFFTGTLYWMAYGRNGDDPNGISG